MLGSGTDLPLPARRDPSPDPLLDPPLPDPSPPAFMAGKLISKPATHMIQLFNNAIRTNSQEYSKSHIDSQSQPR